MTRIGGTGREPGRAWPRAGIAATLVLVAVLSAHRARGLSLIAGRTAVISAGPVSTASILSHAPIVIFGSFTIPLQGAPERVLCAAVMLTLLATARATRLAMDGGREPVTAARGGLHLPTTEPGRAA